MSKLLSANELSRLRADIEAFTLPDTCNVLSNTPVSDGQGGMTDSWGTASASIACRVDPIRADEVSIGASLREYGEYIITVPHNTNLEIDHRIEHNSNTYNITGIRTKGSWEAHERALMVRL